MGKSISSTQFKLLSDLVTNTETVNHLVVKVFITSIEKKLKFYKKMASSFNSLFFY